MPGLERRYDVGKAGTSANIMALTFSMSIIAGDSYQLDLDGLLLVGGIGTIVDNAAIPSSLWSATLRHGYVGCMRDFVINGNAVDLAAFARQQDSGMTFNMNFLSFLVVLKKKKKFGSSRASQQFSKLNNIYVIL